jgi:chromosome segregation ATPase
MPQQLALGVVAAAALLAAGLTVYFWRKSTGLYSLLVEGANRFEELRARNAQLEQAVVKGDEKLRGQRDAVARVEKIASENREKAAELSQKIAAKDAEAKLVSEKLELQKTFLEKQLAKAQEQLRASEEQRDGLAAARQELEQKLARALADGEKTANAAREEGKLRERELVAQMRDLEKTADAAKAKADAVDPVEIKKVRRKIAQYDRLYNSMKGLREMTEERNRNYEVALKKLASYIVAGHQTKLPDQIGPLVGRALEIIGAQLIDDNAPEHRLEDEQGAFRAESMDEQLEPEAEPI